MTVARAVAESTVVAAVRRAAAGSVVWRTVRALTRWPNAARRISEVRRRITKGFGGEWSAEQERQSVAQMDAIVGSSRIAAGVGWVVTRTVDAWHSSRTQQVLSAAARTPSEDVIRICGVAMLVAVVTHTVLLALLGVPVYRLGWASRIVVSAAGLIALRHSAAVVAALKDRRAR